MEIEKNNSLRSSLKMTIDEKKELQKLLKNAKSLEELKIIRSKFYKERGINRATLQDRWEADSNK